MTHVIWITLKSRPGVRFDNWGVTSLPEAVRRLAALLSCYGADAEGHIESLGKGAE